MTRNKEEKLTFTQIRAVGTQVHYIHERLHELTSLRAGGRVDKPHEDSHGSKCIIT